MDSSKILSIQHYPPPRSVKALQSFLGMANFSLQFVPNLCAITYSIRQRLKKNAKYVWSTACQQSFETLKKVIQEAALLAHPNCQQPFKLQTDASNLGLGVVFLQQDEMGRWRRHHHHHHHCLFYTLIVSKKV